MNIAVVILAAGLGTRMKSSLPKVLHKVCGKPMVRLVAETAAGLKPEKTIVVVGPESEGIRTALSGLPIEFCVQKKPLGTGDALKIASASLGGFEGDVLVLGGDTPLISVQTLKLFLAHHKKMREDISLLSFRITGSHAYGRIIRKGNRVDAIVEDRDANEEQKKIDEVNSGIYAIRHSCLDLIKKIKENKAKGEYYLTDIVKLAVDKGLRVGGHALSDELELSGINTRHELHAAEKFMQQKIVSGWMSKGVSFIDAGAVFIHQNVELEADTLIYPNVHIEGSTTIGHGCVIYPGVRIANCIIGNNVTIKDSTVIEDSTVMNGAAVGPFAHIRPKSVIGASVKVGNFVEIKKTVLGEGTKASHLSYLGDAEIGKNVNIGAGTITCNYDGKNKNKTIIEDNVFIGSDTQLIAPVTVKKGSYVGAGSTITKDVPAESLAVSRADQRIIHGWAKKKK
ncbi:MAG: bifunctional UDP-N-acetylglucosamine diphosphorylase/glucosamine-1-phosphate N-acetyltransferase GlmU [Nitrospirae bacterium]|nr:bifunctional UDP-N-acetylglucosamine diphosphorylase/glucosamine-1-phosphate N-acetyltransferase GlmU [Nitrospirota bacterium]